MSTLRTSAADINYLSVSNGVWGLCEGSPYPTSLGGEPDWATFSLCPEQPRAFASILKICDTTHGLRLPAPGTGLIRIAQAMENTADFNNGVLDVQLYAQFGWGGGFGDNVITIKGGCRDIKLWGVIYSHGREADVTIDAWSDQSDALCSGIDLSGLVRADGQPVTIILGRFGSKVAAYPASYQVLFWKSLGYKVYHIAKSAVVKLGFVKEVK